MEIKPLFDANVAPEGLSTVDRPLHGARGMSVRKFEQPWHRAAAYLLAAGKSSGEVAIACEKTSGCVSQVLRNKWFQQNVVELIAENGGKDIMEMFRGEAINSLTTLVELRDNVKTPPAVRVAAARDILDRHLGKPMQRVETVGVPTSSDPVAEAERLERENNRMTLRTVGIHSESQQNDGSSEG